MSNIIEISVNDIEPSRDEILRAQDIDPESKQSKKFDRSIKDAKKLFLEFAHPTGVASEISIPAFENVYQGEGLNDNETPINEIFRKADVLSLFALTIGEDVTVKIQQLFRSNQFLLASFFDTAASVGTDKVADVVENYFYEQLCREGRISNNTKVMQYYPGYCGWHLSGQKKIFKFLNPGKIGITLLKSFIMKPLKSISGLLIAGDKEIHIFKDAFSFCSQCDTHYCQKRIRRFLEEG